MDQQANQQANQPPQVAERPKATLFKYVTGGQEVTFLDDQGLYDAETIRKHWQQTFPELGNCQAETDARTQSVTVNGAEVVVDRVITYVKKVGTKGGDGDQAAASDTEAQRRFDAWYEEVEAENAAAIRRALEAFGPLVINDPTRKRLIDNAPRMLTELQAQRELLLTILEVAVFYSGGREVVVKMLARLERVIGEVTGTEEAARVRVDDFGGGDVVAGEGRAK